MSVSFSLVLLLLLLLAALVVEFIVGMSSMLLLNVSHCNRSKAN
jgi:hypothetical protein